MFNNGEIEGMRSSEGEEILFSTHLLPQDYKGQIEFWLSRLEEMMIDDVRRFLVKALNIYSQQQIEQFTLEQPGQAVVNITMSQWTYETESNIQEKGYTGLYSQLQK